MDEYHYFVSMLKKILISLLIATFIVSGLNLPMAHAQPLLGLPEPGKMVGLSPAYAPTLIKGITVNKDNPFQFDFIVDVGQDKLSGEALKQEGDKLIKYFLASLAIPKEDLWVNLSPYEKDKTVPEALGQTDMGRDLLAQDYMLKQITASLIYPEKSLGKIFWDRVYAKSQELYGNTQIPVNTFNKVWITADQAEVFEHGQTAFVTKSHLKVLLETDYLALQQGSGSKSNQRSQTQKQFGEAGLQQNEITNKIIREIIIPELEKEVNEGKNFANLRQIFNSLILSSWYKNNLKDALLNQVYSNRSTVTGIDIEDKTIKEEIYNRYLQAYKKGVFNFIKEDTVNNQVVPKKYFSGGVDQGMAANPVVTTDKAVLARMLQDAAGSLVNFGVQTTSSTKTSKIDFAQSSKPIKIVDDLVEYFQKISLQEDVSQDETDALSRGLAKLKRIFLAQNIQEESIVQAIKELKDILQDFILTPGQSTVFSELEMFLPKLALAQKQINDVAAQYDDWNLETYNLISQHVIKTVSNQGFVTYKLRRLDTINKLERPVLSFFQAHEGNTVERGLIDDLRANVALAEAVTPEIISAYAIDSDFRSFLLFMAVKFNWISRPDPRDEAFLRMKKQLLAISDQYGSGSKYGIVWSKPTTVVTSMVEAREKSKDYIGGEYQGRGVVSLIIGILQKVASGLTLRDQELKQMQKLINDFEHALNGTDEDKTKQVFSELRAGLTSNFIKYESVNFILAEIEKMLSDLAVVKKYFDKKFVEEKFSEWDRNKYEELDNDTLKFTVTSNFIQGSSHVIGYGYKQHTSDDIDVGALNEDFFTFVYETASNDTDFEVQLKEKIAAIRRFAELANQRKGIFNEAIKETDKLNERNYFLFMAVQLGLMDAPDKAMTQDQMKERFNYQLMAILDLLAADGKIPDEAAFLEALDMDHIDSGFHQLYVEEWRNAGLNDQQSHIKGESESKRHNYLQAYFVYNFIIDSFGNTDYQDRGYANFVKWKYLESFLLVYLREKYSLTIKVKETDQNYSPRTKLLEYLESESKREDSEIRQYTESIKQLLKENNILSLARLLGVEPNDSAFNSLIQESRKIQDPWVNMDLVVDLMALTVKPREDYQAWKQSMQADDSAISADTAMNSYTQEQASTFLAALQVPNEKSNILARVKYPTKEVVRQVKGQLVPDREIIGRFVEGLNELNKEWQVITLEVLQDNGVEILFLVNQGYANKFNGEVKKEFSLVKQGRGIILGNTRSAFGDFINRLRTFTSVLRVSKIIGGLEYKGPAIIAKYRRLIEETLGDIITNQEYNEDQVVAAIKNIILTSKDDEKNAPKVLIAYLFLISKEKASIEDRDDAYKFAGMAIASEMSKIGTERKINEAALDLAHFIFFSQHKEKNTQISDAAMKVLVADAIRRLVESLKIKLDMILTEINIKKKNGGSTDKLQERVSRMTKQVMDLEVQLGGKRTAQDNSDILLRAGILDWQIVDGLKKYLANLEALLAKGPRASAHMKLLDIFPKEKVKYVKDIYPIPIEGQEVAARQMVLKALQSYFEQEKIYLNFSDNISYDEGQRLRTELLGFIQYKRESILTAFEQFVGPGTKNGDRHHRLWRVSVVVREMIKDINNNPSEQQSQMLARLGALVDPVLLEKEDKAMNAMPTGGIDLKATADNIAIQKENEGSGVQMNVDPAMIERIKREGIESLRPVIFSITPVADIWKMIGLTPPLLPGSATQIIK